MTAGADTKVFEALADAAPIAAQIGPFAGRGLLATMWRHTARPGEELVPVADSAGAVVLVVGESSVGLVGPENLVDYRSPIGAPVEALAEWLAGHGGGRRIRFDSLPEAGADVMAEALEGAGLSHERVQHESTAVLTLGFESFDDYLASLSKKERHETRRKVRRFEASAGAPRLKTHTESSGPLSDFFRLHRAGAGEKSQFMTDEMERLFADLLALPGWRLDVLTGDAGDPLAMAVGYRDAAGYYLYNSAYDPEARDISPGVVMLALLIESAIEEGLSVFDFLKGDEAYKYRLGARARPLYFLESSP